MRGKIKMPKRYWDRSSSSKQINSHPWGRNLVILLFLFFCFPLPHPASYPNPLGMVNDFAGVIEEDTKSKQKELIELVKERTGRERRNVCE